MSVINKNNAMLLLTLIMETTYMHHKNIDFFHGDIDANEFIITYKM